MKPIDMNCGGCQKLTGLKSMREIYGGKNPSKTIKQKDTAYG